MQNFTLKMGRPLILALVGLLIVASSAFVAGDMKCPANQVDPTPEYYKLELSGGEDCEVGDVIGIAYYKMDNVNKEAILMEGLPIIIEGYNDGKVVYYGTHHTSRKSTCTFSPPYPGEYIITAGEHQAKFTVEESLIVKSGILFDSSKPAAPEPPVEEITAVQEPEEESFDITTLLKSLLVILLS
jgi:hypothetical protein